MIHSRLKGLSMIELVIYIGIMSLLLLMTTQFALSVVSGQLKAGDVQRLHQAVRQSVALLNNDLHWAASIDTDSSLFEDDIGKLVFTDNQGDIITYERIGDTLQRTKNVEDAKTVIANRVRVKQFRLSHMTYTPKDLNSLRFTFILEAGTVGTDQYYQQSYTSAVTLR